MFVCIYKRNLLPHVSVCMRMHKIHSKFFHVNNLPSKVNENLMKAHPMDNSHCSSYSILTNSSKKTNIKWFFSPS